MKQLLISDLKQELKSLFDYSNDYEVVNIYVDLDNFSIVIETNYESISLPITKVENLTNSLMEDN